MKRSFLVILFFVAILSAWAFEACNSGWRPAPQSGDKNIGTEFDDYQK